MSIDPSTERFEKIIPVLPEDIDIWNHVNNVVYVRWIQEISTAHWNARATDAQKEAVGWVVVRHEIDYVNSAKLGDEILARTWVGTAQKNIFERHAEFIRTRDQKIVAKTRSLWCPIDTHSLRPIRVGADVYAMFSATDEKV
jgi:acyl-CoA thioester hydrolase